MDPKKATIILVEDEPILVQMYALKFKLSGLNLVVSPSADAAVKTIKDGKANLVLLDLQLENGRSGFDILKELKASPDTKNTSVYILSNKRERGNKETSLQLGAVDFLSKTDVTPEELVKIVSKKLENI